MANDVVFITSIFAFFIILGGLLPFINAEFDQSSSEYDTDISGETYSELSDSIDSGDVTTFNILGSIGSIFFYTFGALPLLLELVLYIPRTILVLLIYRQIRSGGG